MRVEPYATIEDMEEYLEHRPYNEDWAYASEKERQVALEDATRRINRLKFVGQPTLTTQINRFPRSPDVEVPVDIKIACCEIALSLLSGIDMEMENENLNVESHAYAGVRTDYNTDLTLEHIKAGIPSITAWHILLRWLPNPGSISINRF